MARTKRTERAAPGPPQLQPGLPPVMPVPVAQDPDSSDATSEVNAMSPQVTPAGAASSSNARSKRSRKARSSTAAARDQVSSDPAGATSNPDKPFRCDYCHPTHFFGRKHDLKRHIDTKHLNERPFSCPRPGCGHATNRRDHARRHFKTHPACGNFIRDHYSVDQSVVLAVERAYGAGSDAWMAELGVQSNVVSSGTPADTTFGLGSRQGSTRLGCDKEEDGEEEDEGEQGGGGDNHPGDTTVTTMRTSENAATAPSGAGIPDPHLFFAHAAESPVHASLRSPFASALSCAAPATSLNDTQLPLPLPLPPPMSLPGSYAVPFVAPPLLPSALTNDTTYSPDTLNRHNTPSNFNSSSQAAPTMSTAPPVTYQLPTWLAMITNPIHSPHPLVDEEHNPFDTVRPAPTQSDPGEHTTHKGLLGSVPRPQ